GDGPAVRGDHRALPGPPRRQSAPRGCAAGRVVTKVPSGAPRPEDLHAGASVVSRDGHKVGTLTRFVVRRDDLVLTHVVVDTGVFRSGDWNGAIGLSHDRLLPLAAITASSEDEV